MKTAIFATRIFVIATALAAFGALGGEAQTTPLGVEPPVIDFGAHDIGTSTIRTVVVTNNGTDLVNATLTWAGSNPSEFSWNSSCTSAIAPGKSCEVSVSFIPLTIAKPENREAQLKIIEGKGASQTVTLKGEAFENLGVSPGSLSFEDRMAGTQKSSRTIIVTNYSGSSISSIGVTVSGDFTADHGECEKIAPGASCAIAVTFAPKGSGSSSGSLTITADQSILGKMPRVVLLQGDAAARCKVVMLNFWSWNVWSVILIAGLYFAGLVMVRWHMIAKPARAQLVAEINVVRSRVMAETAVLAGQPGVAERIERIQYLLDWAMYPFQNKHFPPAQQPGAGRTSSLVGWFPLHTRFFNAMFWPRGQEVSGWSCAHEAEVQLVAMLPPDRVRARMETAEQELRVLKIPIASSLADALHEATSSSPSAVPLERWRALLIEALKIIYEAGDTGYFNLASWHSKMIWLVGCALLFISALAMTLQNAILLLLGAVGGLLSRLARTVSAPDNSSDYGASWGKLFLSPLSGALSAWGGILLIVLGLKFNILGSALNVDWCNPYDPATLAIALLFGFSERLFDGMATQIEDKFLKTPPGAPGSSPSKKTPPSIVSIDPPTGRIREPVLFSVRGGGFVSGATATVTDQRGNAVLAKLEFVDATTVKVSATAIGEQAFTSTLTITNPDKQSGTFRFDVA
jgi:hypothetical protein